MYQGAAFSDFVFVCLGREGASSARPSTLSSSHVPSAGLGAGGHPSFLNGRNVPNAGGALRSEESSSSLTEAQQREIRRKSLSSLASLHGTIYFIHLLIDLFFSFMLYFSICLFIYLWPEAPPPLHSAERGAEAHNFGEVSGIVAHTINKWIK